MGDIVYNGEVIFRGAGCPTSDTIISNGGEVIENDNGTVSVFTLLNGTLNYRPLTKYCCEKLSPSYTWDIDKQTCNWGLGCDNASPFKVILNPTGNDGVIFAVDTANNQTCTLDISFDYLLQLECDKIIDKLNNPLSLTDAQLDAINQLQIEYDKCVAQLSAYQQELDSLTLQLESTPYVIICDKSPAQFTGATDVLSPVDTTVDNPVDTPVEFNPDFDSRFKLPINFQPPNAILLFGLNTLCLTDAGLEQWAIILGVTRYTAWINSNGTDVSLYSCTDVARLDVLNNNSGLLFGTCNISVNARDIIITRIEELTKLISRTDCNAILSQIEILDGPCSTVTEILEAFDVCMTLELVNPDTGLLETIYEETIFNIGAGNLGTYLTNNQPNTGLLTIESTGSTGTCETESYNCTILAKKLMDELSNTLPTSGTSEIQALVENSLDSNWLNFSTNITDQTILDMIYNQKIKISFKIKNCCVDFAILVDRIKLDRNCSNLDSVELRISKSPSFDMIRTLDNKKSWVTNEEFEHREFTLKFRDSEYDINNYKLAINSKEVDLDINPANAIEQDLFCYVRDNLNLLDCYTGNTSGGTGTTECCYVPPVTIDCRVDYDFNSILSSNTLNCDSLVTTACTVDSLWGIIITIGCDTIYSGTPFYTGTTILTAPTENDYINELTTAATELGLTFSASGGTGTFTYTPTCDDKEYLQKCFNVKLNLDITTTCT